MMVSSSSLKEEVAYFHRKMFGFAPTSQLVQAYISAHESQPQLFESSDAQLSTVHTVVTKSLSPMGIEVWLRKGSNRHLLSRKLLLLSYLSECDAGHPEYLANDGGLLKATLKILASSGLAVLSMLKGKWQIYRNGLV